MKNLVLQFSRGDFQSVQENAELISETQIIDKAHIRGLSILALIKRLRMEKYEQAVIFCDDITGDRYLILYRLFLVLARAKKRKLLDAGGNVSEVSRLLFITRDVPLIGWRIIVSFVTVGVTYSIFSYLRFRKEIV